MKMKSRLSSNVQLAFGAALVAVLIVGAISYHSVTESSASDRWVRHTHEVLENLQDLLAAMQMVESNARGYLLTGDESYLDVYRAAIVRTKKDQSIVRNLTADNASQQQRLDVLALLTAQKLALAEKVLNLRRTVGLEEATDAIQRGSGKQIMTEFQKEIAQMQDEELRLLALREANAATRGAQTKGVLILGTVLGLLITSIAGWSAQRDHAARALAEENLREGEERFRTLANNIPQLAWMADEHGSIFWYNDRWFDYTGTT
ncbi:MAG: CHASE3 domain-containing protein, partial [Candidatus Acidiferrales bacterium]